jgi:hypothetical protein
MVKGEEVGLPVDQLVRHIGIGVVAIQSRNEMSANSLKRDVLLLFRLSIVCVALRPQSRLS